MRSATRLSEKRSGSTFALAHHPRHIDDFHLDFLCHIFSSAHDRAATGYFARCPAVPSAAREYLVLRLMEAPLFARVGRTDRNRLLLRDRDPRERGRPGPEVLARNRC